MGRRAQVLCIILLTICSWTGASADDTRFDLTGPRLLVSVTRGDITLPIAQVPNLLAGDLLRIKPDLPPNQLNHLLLVVAFLRDATNEPPDDWFTEVQTWKPAGMGITELHVPAGAQRVLVFVAPETGGDFDSLRTVVKRDPGVFLRAADSLFKVSLQQQRVDRYLSGMQSETSSDDKSVAAQSARLASALLLKPNDDCFKQPTDEQVDCLTKTSSPLVLDSGTQQTLSAQLSTGASSDFFNEAGQNDGGTYSAYVGTIVDMVHLIGLLRTAQYRYIPALSLPDGEVLNTRLNAPPTFDGTKAAIVIALPPIKAPKLPDLHVGTTAKVFCLRNPELVLPIRGSITLYASAFAHDLYLDFSDGDRHLYVPLSADAVAGGLRLDQEKVSQLQGGSTAQDIEAVLRGRWGFDPFVGPTLTFQQRPGTDWVLTKASDLLAGQDATVQLQALGNACLREAWLIPDGTPGSLLAPSMPAAGDTVTLTLPLRGSKSTDYGLQIRQYGSEAPVLLRFRTYSADKMTVNSAYLSPDQSTVTLLGTSLEEADHVELSGVSFTAARSNAGKQVEFVRNGNSSLAKATEATVYRKDGRTTRIPLAAADPTLALRLLSLESSIETFPGELPVEVHTEGAIPLHSVIHFAISSAGRLLTSDHIELAVAEGTSSTQLSFAPNAGQLILEDSATAAGVLDLDKALGESAFGTIRIRLVRTDGKKGPWLPIGNLVRRPHITGIRCAETTCTMHGRELFLLSEISATGDFADPLKVTLSATGNEISFPMREPPSHVLYLRLRDQDGSLASVRFTSPR